MPHRVPDSNLPPLIRAHLEKCGLITALAYLCTLCTPREVCSVLRYPPTGRTTQWSLSGFEHNKGSVSDMIYLRRGRPPLVNPQVALPSGDSVSSLVVVEHDQFALDRLIVALIRRCVVQGHWRIYCHLLAISNAGAAERPEPRGLVEDDHTSLNHLVDSAACVVGDEIVKS